MIHPYDKLKELSNIRDYSDILPGDTVEIRTNSIIMKSHMRNAFIREKEAMDARAKRIRCNLEEVPSKMVVQFKFMKW